MNEDAKLKGRMVFLDTETTGLSPSEGHKIIEIGCVETIDGVITGNNFHVYLNPARKVDAGSFAVHGLSDAFLADKPVFSVIVDDFLSYLQNTTLVIHNASFDMGFINNELSLISRPKLTNEVIDSVSVAKKKFPGSPASLDALCKRFNISLENRTLHGALIDSTLLANVYINLCGGNQVGFFDAPPAAAEQVFEPQAPSYNSTFNIVVISPTPDELLAHEKIMQF